MSSKLPPGSSAYPFRDVTVQVHRPATFTHASPILMVMHGRKRNADEYRDYFVPESDRRGFLVVAPQFPEAGYTHPHDYNYGRMIDKAGAPQPRERWIFPMLEEIFRDVRARADSSREKFFIFGHSAGSQLVHRMATFHWLESVERAVAANAGSYTMPVREERFPFGVDGFGVSDDDLRKLFSRPLLVLLGDRDVDTNDPELPKEPEAMRQGPYRFVRGQRYFEIAQREAMRLRVPLKWRLAIAPGVAHSGQDMAPFAVRELGL
jgi:pimeloyl-ACP methyl ester carboxylesterase